MALKKNKKIEMTEELETEKPITAFFPCIGEHITGSDASEVQEKFRERKKELEKTQ